MPNGNGNGGLNQEVRERPWLNAPATTHTSHVLLIMDTPANPSSGTDWVSESRSGVPYSTVNSAEIYGVIYSYAPGDFDIHPTILLSKGYVHINICMNITLQLAAFVGFYILLKVGRLRYSNQ